MLYAFVEASLLAGEVMNSEKLCLELSLGRHLELGGSFSAAL